MQQIELPRGSGRRWDSLDALRGIAALLVVTFHFAQVTAGFAVRTDPRRLADWAEPWTWLKYTPLRVFVSSGPSAVVLFFVLSGFVLSLPFLRSSHPLSFPAFALKRVCRIYLPFAAAILGSAALYALVRPVPMPALSNWFNTVLWDQPLSVDYVARNLAMTGITRDMSLDLVMWSLVHELRISLIFPLLFLFTRRWPVLAMSMSMLLGVACTEALAGQEAQSVGVSLVDTGRFMFLFTVGILAAINAARIQSAIGKLPDLAAAGLGVLAMALLLSPGPTVYRYFDFTWGVGALLLIALAIGSVRAGRALSARAPVWLGRVSYSLYLVHLPLLIGAVHLAGGAVPLWLTLSGVMATSLLCAEAMHRLVEIPSIQLGRLLARRIEAVGPKSVRPKPVHGEPAPAWTGLPGTQP